MADDKLARPDSNEPAPDPKGKPTKPKTGTIVKTRDGRWQAMLTLSDGTRHRLAPFPKGTSEEYARERAKFWAEKAQKRGIRRPKPKVLKPSPVNNGWFDS